MFQYRWTLTELGSIGTDQSNRDTKILEEEWQMQVLTDKHVTPPIQVPMLHASNVKLWIIGPINAQTEEDNSI